MVATKEYAEVVDVSRVRRITGYLTGETSRWNNAKRAELQDRTCNMGRVGKRSTVLVDEKYEREMQKIKNTVEAEK